MKSYTLAKGIIKAISFFLGIALLLVVLYQVRTLIIYLVIAAVLALLCRPLVFLRRRLNITKTYGAIIALIAVLGLTAGLVYMFVPMLAEQTKNVALYDSENIQKELDKIYVKISEYSGTSKKRSRMLYKILKSKKGHWCNGR